jgi:hypothetical protein
MSEFGKTFWAVTLGVATATIVAVPVGTVLVHKVVAILAARRAARLQQ